MDTIVGIISKSLKKKTNRLLKSTKKRILNGAVCGTTDYQPLCISFRENFISQKGSNYD